MLKRHRFKQTTSLEDRLTAEAQRLRLEAKGMPAGIERSKLLRRAREAETASHLSEWLRSPGPRRPK
jgi:hypothetical protein